MLGVLTSNATKEALVSEQYAGKQIVGMDLHRRRSVLVRMSESGEHLDAVRIMNDPCALAAVMALTAIDLLADGAQGAKGILDGYQPRMTKDQYLSFMRRVFSHETFDGSAE